MAESNLVNRRFTIVRTVGSKTSGRGVAAALFFVLMVK